MFGAFTPELYFEKGDAGGMAWRMERIMLMSPEERGKLGAAMREMVVREHGLDALMDKFTTEMRALVAARK